MEEETASTENSQPNPPASSEPAPTRSYPTLRKETPSRGLFNNRLVQALFAVFLGFLLFLGVLFYLNRPKTETKSEAPAATTSAEQKKDEKTLKTGWVNSADGLNLRAEPSTSSRIVQTLPNGTAFGIISEEGDWFFVEATTRGYLSKKFATVVKPANAKKIYDASEFNFKFVYPENYTIRLSKGDLNTFEFSYNESQGGFTLFQEGTGTTIAGILTQNYPKATNKACDITIGNAKECKMVTDGDETFYLVNTGSTIYKIGILTNHGNLPLDLTGIIFPSFLFEG